MNESLIKQVPEEEQSKFYDWHEIAWVFGVCFMALLGGIGWAIVYGYWMRGG